MELNIEQEIIRSLQAGICESVKKGMGGYNSAFEKLVDNCITTNSTAISAMINGGIAECLKCDEFKQTINQSIRKKLGDLIVQRFGGELEKQVNALKSDPTTRARITTAIDDIIKSMTVKS
jgi:hypothetical protein